MYRFRYCRRHRRQKCDDFLTNYASIYYICSSVCVRALKINIALYGKHYFFYFRRLYVVVIGNVSSMKY